MFNSEPKLSFGFFIGAYMKKINLLAMILVLSSCSGTIPETLGVKENGFSLCSGKPNCVNSFNPTSDKEHFIDPIVAKEGKEVAYKKIEEILKNYPRTKIITQTENYIHAECTSMILRFVDDVEFVFMDDKIQMKSASRVGHSDLGVNRKRLEEIRFKYHQSGM
jgi:uncharacterized protein (DUF1499 family)